MNLSKILEKSIELKRKVEIEDKKLIIERQNIVRKNFQESIKTYLDKEQIPFNIVVHNYVTYKKILIEELKKFSDDECELYIADNYYYINHIVVINIRKKNKFCNMLYDIFNSWTS